jgi:hypothetical protein
MSKVSNSQTDDFAARARARIGELRRAAAQLTEALGLPPEAAHDLAAVVVGVEPAPLPVPAVETAHPIESSLGQGAPADDVVIKTRLHHLVERFLRGHMRDQFDVFRALWEALEPLSLDDIQRTLGRPRAAPGGLGFAGADRTLIAVVSLTGWMLARQRDGAAGAGVALSRDDVAAEAVARGCPRALGFALAEYLTAELRDS